MERKDKQMGAAEGKDSENGHPLQCHFSLTLLRLGIWLSAFGKASFVHSAVVGSKFAWCIEILHEDLDCVLLVQFIKFNLVISNHIRTHSADIGNLKNSPNNSFKKVNQRSTIFHCLLWWWNSQYYVKLTLWAFHHIITSSKTYLEKSFNLHWQPFSCPLWGPKATFETWSCSLQASKLPPHSALLTLNFPTQFLQTSHPQFADT